MLHELGILNGATRIDIAVITGQIEGYELKSERDTIQRRPAQRDLHNKVMDRIRLAATGIISKTRPLSAGLRVPLGVSSARSIS